MSFFKRKPTPQDATHSLLMQDEVILISRESPAFAAAVAECTPVSEIETKHGMNKLFVSGSVDRACRMRRKDSNDRIH